MDRKRVVREVEEAASAGSYLCTLSTQPQSDEPPVYHAEAGMVGTLEVTGAGGGTLPKGDTTVVAKEDGDERLFEIPANLRAGKNTIEFINRGQEAHHIQAFPIVAGKTFADVTAAFAEMTPTGPPPIDIQRGSGTSVIDEGDTIVTELELQAGSYVFLCFISDRKGGPPHFVQGMINEVTVV